MSTCLRLAQWRFRSRFWASSYCAQHRARLPGVRRVPAHGYPWPVGWVRSIRSGCDCGESSPVPIAGQGIGDRVGDGFRAALHQQTILAMA